MSTDQQSDAEILVIDDDAIMRDLMADWLDAAGYRVRTATSCGAWISQLFRQAPALIITDMCMPGPCNADAIGSLKKKHPGTTVIAVSGHFESGQSMSAEGALAAGADRALAKPIKRADLMQAVAELVGPPGKQS